MLGIMIHLQLWFEEILNMGTKWKMTKISELAEVTVGFVGKITNHYVDSGVPIIRSKDIVPYSVLEEQLLEVSREFHNSNSKSSLSPGDVVVVRTGKPGTACVIPPVEVVNKFTEIVEPLFHNLFEIAKSNQPLLEIREELIKKLIS